MQRSSAPVSVLLIHGAGGGAWQWRIWQHPLHAHGLHTHAMQWQPSPQGLPQTTLHDYIQQAQHQLAQLPRPVALVGASLGGLIAAQLAAQQADSVHSLTLINAVPPAPWHQYLPERAFTPTIAWQRNARLASTRASMPSADAATALAAFRRWRDESGAAVQQAWNGMDIASPNVPVFSIIGANDQDVPAHASLQWAQAWQAHIHWLADGDHLSPLLGHHASHCATAFMDWLSLR